jgi:hypothetical protein
MNKKIFSFIVVAAIALAAGWNIHQSRNNILSDVALENVEALAEENGGSGSCSCSKKCGDGNTTASCTGYSFCNCNSGFNHVTCDGVSASC